MAYPDPHPSDAHGCWYPFVGNVFKQLLVLAGDEARACAEEYDGKLAELRFTVLAKRC